jgi:hypothetical protein
MFALDEKHAEGEAGLGDSRSSRPLAAWRSALKRKPATDTEEYLSSRAD